MIFIRQDIVLSTSEFMSSPRTMLTIRVCCGLLGVFLLICPIWTLLAALSSGGVVNTLVLALMVFLGILNLGTAFIKPNPVDQTNDTENPS